MDDPGYSGYDDPRLQPPSGYYHERTAGDDYEECRHQGACRRALEQCGFCYVDDDFGWVDEIAKVLKCDECEEWAE